MMISRHKARCVEQRRAEIRLACGLGALKLEAFGIRFLDEARLGGEANKERLGIKAQSGEALLELRKIFVRDRIRDVDEDGLGEPQLLFHAMRRAQREREEC